MPFGLPNSLMNIIYPNFDLILLEEYKNNNLIYIDPNDNWIHINDFKKEIQNFFINRNKEKKECLLKCIKAYAKLFFYYIEKIRQNICFPDTNIHYIFNSYNNKGIWKSFDSEMYAYCFYFEYLKNKNEYEHILNNNFELEKHMKNISSLILENLDDIKDLIKNSDYNREYI